MLSFNTNKGGSRRRKKVVNAGFFELLVIVFCLSVCLSVYVCVCVCLCVWDGGWGVDGGWMPLPTRPQRYCDPASLVLEAAPFS